MDRYIFKHSEDSNQQVVKIWPLPKNGEKHYALGLLISIWNWGIEQG